MPLSYIDVIEHIVWVPDIPTSSLKQVATPPMHTRRLGLYNHQIDIHYRGKIKLLGIVRTHMGGVTACLAEDMASKRL